MRMPTYDYRCAHCGSVFEKFHGMNENPAVECPSCHSTETARQVSLGAGIVFKGSGFYVNDYKNASTPAASSAPKVATEKSEPNTASAEKSSTPDASAHACGPSCSHAG